MAKTSLHAFKAKDLHKLCSVFERIQLKVFKNNLYYLWHVGVLSIKPCLHTLLPEHNKSYWKVSRGWGHFITFNSFSASGGGNLNKIFPKTQMPGGLPGGMLKLRFDWYITDRYLGSRYFDYWFGAFRYHVVLASLSRYEQKIGQMQLMH